MNSLNIQINDRILQNTETVKLLGLTIDQNLAFKNHITNICVSARRKLNALQRIRKYLFLDQTRLLANAYIYSQLSYCNLLWMFCSKSETNELFCY